MQELARNMLKLLAKNSVVINTVCVWLFWVWVVRKWTNSLYLHDPMLYSHLEGLSLVLSSLPEHDLNSSVSDTNSLELHHWLYLPQLRLGIKQSHFVNTPSHHYCLEKKTIAVLHHHSEMWENNNEIWCLVYYTENQSHGNGSSNYVLEQVSSIPEWSKGGFL